MLLHDIILMSYCCQRYTECLVMTLCSSRTVHRHTAPSTRNIWTAASRNAKLSCVQRVASKQLRSQSVITKSGLSCSIVSTTDKFIVWMNWNGGSSTSGAVLNSWFLDETIDQWRGRHRAYVHAKGGQFEYSLWTDNVDFVHTCYIQCDLFDCCILITKSCQQCWPIHSCSFYKVVH